MLGKQTPFFILTILTTAAATERVNEKQDDHTPNDWNYVHIIMPTMCPPVECSVFTIIVPVAVYSGSRAAQLAFRVSGMWVGGAVSVTLIAVYVGVGVAACSSTLLMIAGVVGRDD